MFCNKCGKQLKDENKFCPTCGSAVTQDNVTVIKGEGKRKAKNPLGIVCIILSVLLVLSVVGNGIQLVNRGQRSNQLAQKDNTDMEQVDKVEEKEQAQEQEIAENRDINIGNYRIDFGDSIVGDGENIYYSLGGSIIHWDNSDTENVIYSGERIMRLYLQEDKIYFQEYRASESQYYLCSMKLDGSGKKDLHNAKNIYSCGFYDDCLYCIELVNNEVGEDEVYINRYCESDTKQNISFYLGKRQDYQEGEPYLFCMDPYNKDAVIYEIMDKREEGLNDEGIIESGTEFYKVSSTDFQNNLYSFTYSQHIGNLGYGPERILTEDYVYYHYPYNYKYQSLKEYYGEEVKQCMIPTVIRESEYLELYSKMDEWQQDLLTQRYKKLDINNLSESDNRRIEELLITYPIMQSEIVYVLREATKNNVRAKLEEYFADAGYTAKMYLEHKELDKTKQEKRTTFYEPYIIECKDPITQEIIFKVWIENYIKKVLECYENDIIVYAYIDEKWGIFRITEETMRNYQNEGGIEAELLVELNGEYKKTSDNLSVETHVSGDTLYYSVEYGEQVGSVKLN